MGETGCGKTRLLKYLCKLASQNAEYKTQTGSCIVVLKVRCIEIYNNADCQVHGGTTRYDIEKAVKHAEKIAVGNREIRAQSDGGKSPPVFGTVLFFDEANTSENVNLIKEIMCDGTVLGKKIDKDLRVVAACNPYRM